MRHTSAGFTLLETMVVVALLVGTLALGTGLAGIILSSVQENKNRLTALYLTQECSELVRNLRDSAWRQNLPWDCAFPDATATYRLWSTQRTPSSTDPGSICTGELGITVQPVTTPQDLILWRSAGRYGHDTDPSFFSPTPFSRSVTLEDKTDDALTANCTVSWGQGTARHEVEISQRLTNWKRK